ncbi:MAG: hypothetical protein LH613_00025 [Chamaesiphon sp.]|nr:hypothetical protein [Chamaesiphon sp.]
MTAIRAPRLGWDIIDRDADLSAIFNPIDRVNPEYIEPCAIEIFLDFYPD